MITKSVKVEVVTNVFPLSVVYIQKVEGVEPGKV